MESFRDRPYGIASYPCLSADECRQFSQKVIEALPKAYHQVLPMKNELYTLGSPYFLLKYLKDYSLQDYFTLTRRMNALLRSDFQLLFQKVADVISEVTGFPAEAYPSETSPLPGIQVYPSHPAYTKSRHWHFDYCIHLEDAAGQSEEQRLNSMKSVEYLVFILCLRAPEDGAFMRIKDAKAADWAGVPVHEMLNATTSLPEHRHDYGLGLLNIHSGKYLHTGGFTDGTGPNDLRICYQGAAILKNNSWQLFWG